MKNFLKIVLFIDFAIFALAGTCSWLITDLKFGTALVWTGIGTIIIGSFAALGGWSVAPGEYNLKFDQKLPQLNYERTPDKWSEMHKSYSFCLYMAAAAIIPIIMGVLIDQYLN